MVVTSSHLISLTPKKGFSAGIPSKWPECSSVNYHLLKFHLHESERTGFGSHPQKSITGIRQSNVPPIRECNSQILCGIPGYRMLRLGCVLKLFQVWQKCRALQLSTSHSPSNPCKLQFLVWFGMTLDGQALPFAHPNRSKSIPINNLIWTALTTWAGSIAAWIMQTLS